MSKPSKKPFVVLHMIGAGPRTITIAHYLNAIRVLRDNKHITGGVDFFSASSGAEIIATSLNLKNPEDPNTPLYDEQGTLSAFQESLPTVFHRHHTRRHVIDGVADRLPKSLGANSLRKRARYDSRNLEQVLKSRFLDATLDNTLRGQSVPIKEYNNKHIIRLVHLPEQEDSNYGQDTALYKAVTANCMHPLCFDMYPLEINGKTIQSQDGGMAEHPFHVYRFLKDALPKNREIIMIVLSPGEASPPNITPATYNLLSSWGKLNPRLGAPLVAELMQPHDPQMMGHLKKELGENLVHVESKLADYFDVGKEPIIDDVRPETIERYISMANDMVEKNADTFKTICKILNDRETIRNTPVLKLEQSWRVQTSQPIAANIESPPRMRRWFSWPASKVAEPVRVLH